MGGSRVGALTHSTHHGLCAARVAAPSGSSRTQDRPGLFAGAASPSRFSALGPVVAPGREAAVFAHAPPVGFSLCPPFQTVLTFPDESNEQPPRGRLFLDERDRSFFLANRYTQVCPRCLDEDEGYDHLYWRCDLLLLCPRHRVFLVRHCATRHARIPAFRPLPTTCPSCEQGDYRSAVLSPQLEEEPWLQASHALLLGHLGVEPTQAGTEADSASSTPLQLLDPWDFFWLLKEFTRIFDPTAPHEKVLPFLVRTFSLKGLVARASACRGISREASSRVILHYLLPGWPAHFQAFLSQIQRVIQEEYHYPAESVLVLNWGSAMVRGNYWCRRAYEADTIPRMRLFFGAYTECFERLPPAELVEQRRSEPLVLSWHLKPVTTEHAVEPHPWESLSSVLRRVARKVGYSRPELLLHQDEGPPAWSFPRDITLLRHGEGFGWLARRLCLNEETLYRSTLHRLATTLEPALPSQRGELAHPLASGVPPLLSQEAVRRFCVPPGTTRLCPACIKEEEWQEPLYWKLRYVLLCPRHSIVLIDRCPGCRSLIPHLLHADDTLCVHCRREDFRAAPRVVMSSHSLLQASQALILRFLGVDGSDRGEIDSRFTGSPLLRVEPWQYFHLLDRFGTLAPALAGMPGAFNKEIDCQQEFPISQLREKGRVARHVILFHCAYASYQQFLEQVAPLLRLPGQSDGVFEEAIQPGQTNGNALGATASSYEVYSPLLHDLDGLILAAQMRSHRRREEIYAHPRLHRAK